MFFLVKEQSCYSVNGSVIIIFMLATQSGALMQKLLSFVNIMSQDKSATVWHKVCTDMKVISIPAPPESVSSLAGSRVGRFALACKSTCITSPLFSCCNSWSSMLELKRDKHLREMTCGL